MTAPSRRHQGASVLPPPAGGLPLLVRHPKHAGDRDFLAGFLDLGEVLLQSLLGNAADQARAVRWILVDAGLGQRRRAIGFFRNPIGLVLIGADLRLPYALKRN